MQPILTDELNDLIAPYHDRMPLALADDRVSDWLDLSRQDSLSEPQLLDLAAFNVRPMNRAINNVRQKDLTVIEGGNG